ncbi:MAG TPA: Bax inhibitor-1/YccA family protein [Pseudomonadales bacterium]|nr:Bax inhibitor-1/YccA family protein [Pseudomonadales bacterium]
MRSSNPALKKNFDATLQGPAMTLSGAINRTAMLLAILTASAAWTWNLFYQSGGNPAVIAPYMMGGLLGGFIVALIAIFKPATSPYTAPLYAVLEGFAIGGASAMFEHKMPGVVIQAVGLTLGTLAALLMAYKTGLIKATENFKLGVVAATGGVALVYLVDMVLRIFGMNVPFIHSHGPVGIGVSLVIVGIAALNLVLDFDFIEENAASGAPKYMEWYAGFSLLLTLVWLYLEMLRLLSKLRD